MFKIIRNNTIFIPLCLIFGLVIEKCLYQFSKSYLIYTPKMHLILIASSSICLYALGQILVKRYHRFYNYLFLLSYCGLIYVFLFCRVDAVSGINLEIFAYNELDLNNITNLKVTLFNILLFLPFGLISFKTKIMNNLSFLGFIIITFIIEIFQTYLHVGVFDITDIILYIIGFILGRLIRNIFYQFFSLRK